MKRMPLFSTLLALLFLTGTLAFASDHPKPMTDDDVIAMVKAGLPDDTIISAINAQSTDFDVSAMALVNLKNQGVSVKVIDAMLAAGKKQQDAHASSASASGSNSSSSGTGSGSGSGTGASVQREQFAPATNSNQPPADNASANSQNSAASGNQSAPAQHGNFFDKLNQTQNAITGTVQQGQSNYQQMRNGMPGHQQANAAGQTQSASPNSYPATTVSPGVNSQPQTPGAYPGSPNPAATNQAAAQARYQQQQRQQQQQQVTAASRQAAIQQQRQQQAAAAQQRAARIAACRQQAMKVYPKGGPDFSKAYASCIQAP